MPDDIVSDEELDRWENSFQRLADDEILRACRTIRHLRRERDELKAVLAKVVQFFSRLG